jgi:hypothetical protein
MDLLFDIAAALFLCSRSSAMWQVEGLSNHEAGLDASLSSLLF